MFIYVVFMILPHFLRFGCLSDPQMFTCWISFALVVQFYLLLSPYLCFISFLYLDLYILGDDALIS